VRSSLPTRFRRDDGSASIEMVGVLPFLLLALLIGAQLALAGQALWSAGIAARAGARAALVGGDPAAVAREALPPAMSRGAEVGASAGVVSVEVPIPRLLPMLPAVSVSAGTRLGPDG
jgi:hypothetical protein